MQQQLILNELIRNIPSLSCDWEIYFLRRSLHVVEGKDLIVDKNKHSQRETYSIRVLKDQRAGYSICNHPDKIEEAFKSALGFAEISERDEFIFIPEPEKPKEINLFDKTLLDHKVKLSEYLIEMQQAALRDTRVKKLRNAEIYFAIEQRGIINSKGLMISDSFTSISAHIIAIAEDRDSQMGWAYRSERFLKNIDFEAVGKEAAQKAISLLNPNKINPFKGWLLLDPYVASEFLELISNSLSAENFQLGKSLFIKKMNEEVMPHSISIIDDGLIPEKYGSTPFDGEGVPTGKKFLIDRGILKELMHNSYTAKRAGMVRSTGNAIRSDRGITIGPTNLYIEFIGNRGSQEELISIIDRGIYVIEVMGMHTANPVSGDFSVGISGIYIERGELKHSIKEAIISGNVVELFKNIRAAGSNVVFYGNIGAPTLLVEGIDISG